MNMVVEIFVIVAAVAIILQMAILFALYRGMRQSSAKMEGIASRLEQQASPILATTQEILEDAKPKIAEITSNLAESTATVRAHVSQVAEASRDIVDRARMQAERFDEFVGSTLGKIESTAELLESKVLSPVRRVQAIMQAVTAGLGFLRSNRSRPKTNHNSATEDEEMFI